jgi:hypothetical protein
VETAPFVMIAGERTLNLPFAMEKTALTYDARL